MPFTSNLFASSLFESNLFVSKSQQQTVAFCKQLLDKINNSQKPIVILLNGDLGAGKTFISSNLIKILSKNSNINVPSPTFNIVLQYKSFDGVNINHYDLYRIKNPEELNNIGFYESLFDSITIIEWPQICLEYINKFKQLNTNTTIINIEIELKEDESRIINLSNY